MKVFVTGGTGAIGGHAVPALIEADHVVTALSRSVAKDAVLERQGAKPVRVDLFDRAALAEAMSGHDAVVNLATALPSMAKFLSRAAHRDNTRIRTQGSATLVDAAIDARVGRFVQESVSMLYRDRGAEWVDEDWPADHYPMARGNHAAEANARRFTEAGGVGVVLRFGWFYGPGAAHAEQMLAAARRHVGLMLGPPGGYLSTIHLADAATAVVAALAVPAGTYNVVDDEPLTKREFTRAMAHAAGARTWVRGPGSVALLFGSRMTSLTRSLRVSNARLREASDWRPRYPSAREGWTATATHLHP
ncbi:NAD(P)H-binding protein [Amycolatopsis endophytica]|uniref:Nucleoside-diphosphate-sugar epimerase n=1 Tax=Amycolatopsis endophytica TaxID=860233 RepID=A0A853B3B8_9PSEU|nr:NAD(P)-dependent oxidoreductase [Amycolatopsis endophytica]NYI89500.1 nucleoside-diphosphate-sugar epimerase [Amycolatopsis endophytica]